jgi:hypothetical protein
MEGVVIRVPVPADPVGLLEAFDLVTGHPQLLEGRQARRARADYAVTGHCPPTSSAAVHPDAQSAKRRRLSSMA